MHVTLIGATGATGSDLLDLLLADPAFHQVDIFVRREIDKSHEKLRVHVIDFDRPTEWQHLVKGDLHFSALGTTLRDAGSKDAQWKIDYDYQYDFAAAARENGMLGCVLVSAANADPGSMFFYSKMKGQLEEAIKALRFPSLSIFHPPILDRKDSKRSAEVIGVKVLRFLNSLGILRSQKPLPTTELARAMVAAAKIGHPGTRVYPPREIRHLVQL